MRLSPVFVVLSSRSEIARSTCSSRAPESISSHWSPERLAGPQTGIRERQEQHSVALGRAYRPLSRGLRTASGLVLGAQALGQSNPIECCAEEGRELLVRHRIDLLLPLGARKTVHALAAVAPDLEYTFKHALTHEVAYSTLLHDQRQRLHALVVEALEQQYADRIGEQIEHLAHHAFRRELWEKALTYLTQAGLRAQQRCAHRGAVAFSTKR